MDELRDMVGNGSDAFSNKVLHFRGQSSWNSSILVKAEELFNSNGQHSWTSTIFFTHSAADLQWPELAHFLGVEDPENSTSRSV